VSFPLTQEGMHKVDSLVANIVNIYFGQETYKTPEEKAVAYLYFLIKDHPFTDGNKRTASLAFSVICRINSIYPNHDEYPLDALSIFIEKITESDHQNVIRALSRAIFKKKKDAKREALRLKKRE
jgi:prophage maintenance system killer protein